MTFFYFYGRPNRSPPTADNLDHADPWYTYNTANKPYLMFSSMSEAVFQRQKKLLYTAVLVVLVQTIYSQA